MAVLGERRRLSGPVRAAIAGAGVFVFALFAGIGGALLSERTGPLAVAGTAGLMALTMAVCMAGGVWWWAKLDEAAREAHKWSWWWGGSSGLAIGAVLLLTLAIRDDVSSLAWIGSQPADYFQAGIMAILSFQMIGYVVAWAGWWFVRR